MQKDSTKRVPISKQVGGATRQGPVTDVKSNLARDILITNEITNQLRELKAQLNKEIVEDLQVMRNEITKAVTAHVDEKIAQEIERQFKAHHTTIAAEVDKKLAASDKQIALSRQSTNDIVQKMGQNIYSEVYGRIMGDINKRIVPEVNKMVQWVNYNMQDGNAIVDSYRRDVEKQSEAERGVLHLTDGKKDERIISPHVRTFFSEAD